MNKEEIFQRPHVSDFIRWLKNKGIYNEYVSEYIKYYYRLNRNSKNRKGVLDWWISRIHIDNIRSIINTTLCWSHTKRGDDFWYEMHKEWYSYACSRNFL